MSRDSAKYFWLLYRYLVIIFELILVYMTLTIALKLLKMEVIKDFFIFRHLVLKNVILRISSDTDVEAVCINYVYHLQPFTWYEWKVYCTYKSWLHESKCKICWFFLFGLFPPSADDWDWYLDLKIYRENMWKIICKTEVVNLNLMAITYSSLPHKKQQKIKKKRQRKKKRDTLACLR